MTQIINISEANTKWSEILNKVLGKEVRVVVEKSGVPVAAIISAKDLERFNRLEKERERDFSIIDEMSEAFKDIPPEEIEREAAKALAEVREEARQKRIAKSRD